MIRQVHCFALVHPDDCDPPHGLDLDSPHDAQKVNILHEMFARKGFDLAEPALVGYPLKGRIQLLTGTHRHLAAKRANILLPVTLWLRSDVEETWGTPLWLDVIKDIPAAELVAWIHQEGSRRSPYEPINLEILDD